MVFLKSVLAGAGALIVAALIISALFFGGPLLKLLTDRNGGGGVVVFGLRPLPIVVVSLLVFATRFFWQYRRSR